MGSILAACTAAFTLGGIVTLLLVRRPPRHCIDCGEPLAQRCTEQAACNRRREARELQRIVN